MINNKYILKPLITKKNHRELLVAIQKQNQSSEAFLAQNINTVDYYVFIVMS